MKKILLVAIIFLNLSVLPSFATEQKVVKVTQDARGFGNGNC
jgi:hypothetical protein